MKTKPINPIPDQCLYPHFDTEVAFEMTPLPGVVPSETVQLRFVELQNRLVEETLRETPNPFLREGLHQAANEAAALSWTTPFPLLVMPVLFSEKAHSVRLRLGKQHRVSMKSQSLAEDVSDLNSA